MGDSVHFQQLQRAHFEYYLRSFSPTVQQILHVSSLNSESEYLESRMRYHEYIEPICFFVAIDTITHTIVGALEVRPPTSSA